MLIAWTKRMGYVGVGFELELRLIENVFKMCADGAAVGMKSRVGSTLALELKLLLNIAEQQTSQRRSYASEELEAEHLVPCMYYWDRSIIGESRVTLLCLCKASSPSHVF